MPHLSPILASGDDAIFKIGFWVVVALIWGISSLVSSLKKKIAQSQTTLRTGQLPPGLATRIQPPMPPPRPFQPTALGVAVPVPLPTYSVPATAAPTGKKKGKRKHSGGGAAAQPPPLPSQAAEPARQSLIAPPMAAPERTKARATNLADILRPASLRNQWLLTEILAKPVALREEPTPRR